ncbi:hypothetical protein ABC969_07615 [Sphingomonas qilianensis]|uniref:HTH araC/xylS-type domain-containing protein n=1 Tax=Sphingomonas qilianensis TaxID=1736690 RepID=A0ABU9XR37_9SPHN
MHNFDRPVLDETLPTEQRGAVVGQGQMLGGTNCPGIAVETFAMPPGMSIRYDQPANDLADYITGYHVYCADTRHRGQVDWFLPGAASIRIAIDAEPFSVSIARRTFDPVPQVSLFGPTSHALRAVTNSGILIGFGISALGWSRLIDQPAAAFRDRVAPLATAVAGDFGPRLYAALQATDREGQVAPVLDALLREQLTPLHHPRGAACAQRDDALVRQLMAFIARDGSIEIGHIAATLGLEPHALRRLAVRHFGFPPKLLVRRARFLRSFLRILGPGHTIDYGKLDQSYFDLPHFLRDANTFLGTTPRRFLARSTPFLDASLRARAAVLGAPTQALHDIDAPKPGQRKGAASMARDPLYFGGDGHTPVPSPVTNAPAAQGSAGA